MPGENILISFIGNSMLGGLVLEGGLGIADVGLETIFNHATLQNALVNVGRFNMEQGPVLAVAAVGIGVILTAIQRASIAPRR